MGVLCVFSLSLPTPKKLDVLVKEKKKMVDTNSNFPSTFPWFLSFFFFFLPMIKAWNTQDFHRNRKKAWGSAIKRKLGCIKYFAERNCTSIIRLVRFFFFKKISFLKERKKICLCLWVVFFILFLIVLIWSFSFHKQWLSCNYERSLGEFEPIRKKLATNLQRADFTWASCKKWRR